MEPAQKALIVEFNHLYLHCNYGLVNSIILILTYDIVSDAVKKIFTVDKDYSIDKATIDVDRLCYYLYVVLCSVIK